MFILHFLVSLPSLAFCVETCEKLHQSINSLFSFWGNRPHRTLEFVKVATAAKVAVLTSVRPCGEDRKYDISLHGLYSIVPQN